MNPDKFVRFDTFMGKLMFITIVIGDIMLLHYLLISIIEEDLRQFLLSLLMVVILSVAIKPLYDKVLENDKIVSDMDNPPSKLN